MSIEYINAVLGSELRGNKRMIMLVMAHHCDNDGMCWPSIRRVAEQAKASLRTVQRAINEFETKGLLIRDEQFRQDGSQRSSLYMLDKFAISGKRNSVASASPHANSLKKESESVREGVTKSASFQDKTNQIDTPRTTTDQSKNYHRCSSSDLHESILPNYKALIIKALNESGLDDRVCSQIVLTLNSRQSTPNNPVRNIFTYARGIIKNAQAGAFVPEVDCNTAATSASHVPFKSNIDNASQKTPMGQDEKRLAMANARRVANL